MDKFNKLFNIFMEEVSTFLNSENKVKSDSDDSVSDSANETNNETNNVQECCDGRHNCWNFSSS